ncbi:MAG: hypothetical protein IPM79_16905 [Polyangiaceae bacterium]|nr:hypothetical protein [Polyangiaceae bacterium]
MSSLDIARGRARSAGKLIVGMEPFGPVGGGVVPPTRAISPVGRPLGSSSISGSPCTPCTNISVGVSRSLWVEPSSRISPAVVGSDAGRASGTSIFGGAPSLGRASTLRTSGLVSAAILVVRLAAAGGATEAGLLVAGRGGPLFSASAA